TLQEIFSASQVTLAGAGSFFALLRFLTRAWCVRLAIQLSRYWIESLRQENIVSLCLLNLASCLFIISEPDSFVNPTG
ncbi:MAG: hypothetical protein VKP62_04920, partial [Candidatus Sericytochromatia bacterium]|nr:hypothetical protein [Candidatus Sericytochromatia bacterium]